MTITMNTLLDYVYFHISSDPLLPTYIRNIIMLSMRTRQSNFSHPIGHPQMTKMKRVKYHQISSGVKKRRIKKYRTRTCPSRRIDF